MRRCLRLLGAVLILGGCATVATDAPLRAQAVLRDTSGQQVGTATLTEGADGVRIQVTASHLPPVRRACTCTRWVRAFRRTSPPPGRTSTPQGASTDASIPTAPTRAISR